VESYSGNAMPDARGADVEPIGTNGMLASKTTSGRSGKKRMMYLAMERFCAKTAHRARQVKQKNLPGELSCRKCGMNRSSPNNNHS